MHLGEAGWEDYLTELRQLTESDFCAVAEYDSSARQIQWKAASGNTNEKYRYIVNRTGKGISGEVIRIGRIVQRTCISDEERRSTDSIMLAERLVIAAAAPIHKGDIGIEGVLLIGRRNEAKYTAADLNMLEKACSHIAGPEKLNI
ncbi:GAF domain-containing protein [Paenibacillus dakarensis]|uniref:GAF domain-containing protein n=1 Tax=Paenibacillus dakarensis TaxID=1527293 RepID=UPI0006D56FB6|nr:GAF domain-containing protein [Paenibacillus dakarensis]